MAWDDQQPPWGRKKGPQTPEELIAALLNKIKDAFEGRRSAGDAGGPTPAGASPGGERGPLGKLALLVGAFVLVNILFSAFYTLEPGERGVVLRFGKYAKTANPGLNFKLPLIDEVLKVDIENVRKEEFGFRTRETGQRTQYQKQGYEEESLVLTSDRNVIDVEWIVQYKVQDPLLFSFEVKDVRQAVRDVSEMAMRRIVGNMTFDYVLSNREVLAGQAQREMQDALDAYETGLRIVTVQLQDVNPPEAVKPAFNEVNEADQDMKRLVNEAEEAYNREVPKARGEAKKLLEDSQGYAVERVNLAKGETSRFLAVLKEYRAAKDVTRQRLYIETMQAMLPNVTEIYVVDREQRSILPLLDLSGAGRLRAPAAKAAQ